jgi:hypothetical protein
LIRPREFLVFWFIVFVIATDATAFLLWEEARHEGRPFFSPELQLILRALLPCLLIPAAFTICFSTPVISARGNWIGRCVNRLLRIGSTFHGHVCAALVVFAGLGILIHDLGDAANYRTNRHQFFGRASESAHGHHVRLL